MAYFVSGKKMLAARLAGTLARAWERLTPRRHPPEFLLYIGERKDDLPPES